MSALALHVVKHRSKVVLSFVVNGVFNSMALGKADLIKLTNFLFRSRDISKLKSRTIISFSEDILCAK